MNTLLQDVASELGVDLWTLDALWWRVSAEEIGEELEGKDETYGEGVDQRFGLERHLHDFLYDNWSDTELGRDWGLYEEDGEIVGYEYNTGEIGKIDLLARHRSGKKWLVVELKRGQTSDDTVGQLLRYRGWVRRHLAEPDEEVPGLIICRHVDPKLLYALIDLEGVGVQTYTVHFSLQEAAAV